MWARGLGDIDINVWFGLLFAWWLTVGLGGGWLFDCSVVGWLTGRLVNSFMIWPVVYLLRKMRLL